MADEATRERKIFVWVDEAGEIHVSIAHQTKEELQDAFDWEPNEKLIRELPFKLEGAEGLGGESPENYYRAIEGFLQLQGVAATLEILMAQMVRAGVSLAKYLPRNNRIQ